MKKDELEVLTEEEYALTTLGQDHPKSYKEYLEDLKMYRFLYDQKKLKKLFYYIRYEIVQSKVK